MNSFWKKYYLSRVIAESLVQKVNEVSAGMFKRNCKYKLLSNSGLKNYLWKFNSQSNTCKLKND